MATPVVGSHGSQGVAKQIDHPCAAAAEAGWGTGGISRALREKGVEGLVEGPQGQGDDQGRGEEVSNGYDVEEQEGRREWVAQPNSDLHGRICTQCVACASKYVAVVVECKLLTCLCAGRRPGRSIGCSADHSL